MNRTASSSKSETEKKIETLEVSNAPSEPCQSSSSKKLWIRSRKFLNRLSGRDDRLDHSQSKSKSPKIISDTSTDLQTQSDHLSRLATIMRLVRLALSDPWLTMRLANPRMFKNIVYFLIKNDVNPDRIVNKYKKIYLSPHRKNSFVSRMAAMLKLARVALLNPSITIKQINRQFLKNAFQFLFKKEADGDHVFKKYQQIYFKSDFESSVNLHSGVKELVSLYKLPVSREEDSNIVN